MARASKSAEPATIELPHPRTRATLYGHEIAEKLLLEAYQAKRLHHAWMICGLRGIGKATFAYRAARFALANPKGAKTLFISENEPVFHLVAQNTHPDCHTLELEEKKKSISVDAVRVLSEKMRATAGGWRVAIIDALEDLNAGAANALLKILEEPPARCLFLLVSHQPGLVKMTLRSRCQKLHLKPLADDLILKIAREVMPEIPADKIKAALPYAHGSAGAALALAGGAGLAESDMLHVVLNNLPAADIKLQQQLCDAIARKGEEAFSEAVALIAQWCHDIIIAEPAHLYAAALADFSAGLNEGAQRVTIFNLDRKAFLITQLGALGRLVRMQAAA